MKHILTKRQIEVLKHIHENDSDIVSSYGETYYGDNKTNMKLVASLLRLALIKCDDYTNFNTTERYFINSDGIKAYQQGFIER